MAKSVDPNMQKVLDFLPKGSEIPFDEWRQKIIDANMISSLRLMQAARRQKLVTFRLTDTGEHLVKLA